MASWKINVENKTGSKVNVMIFQTVPDDLKMGSYCTAWRVIPTEDPGNFDLKLPDTFDFYVIDRLSYGERHTGPYKVTYGQEVVVTQTNAEDEPKVTINSVEFIPKDRIKVFNKSGNAQKLEMALFKNESKMICYKDIRPGDFLFMAIKPNVYMSAVNDVKQGQEFLTGSIVDATEFIARPLTPTSPSMSDPVQANFKLLKEKPEMKVQIAEKTTGEYKFTEL